MNKRLFNALVGIWLFATGFMWPHTAAQKSVTIVAAILTFVLAILANFTSVAPYLNACVAMLLFVASTMALPTLRLATLWNNTIVAVMIFAVSLADSGPEALRHRGDIYGRH
jgi:nitric oxide reductase large subunit